MVESIKGPGQKIIIIKPQAKEPAEKTKDGGFDKVLQGKNTGEAANAAGAPRTKAEANQAVVQQQNLHRMQRLDSLAKSIREGTYKGVEPEALAGRFLEIILDKKTKDKFIKKFLSEEMEQAKAKGKPLSDLELKKLIFLVKGSKDQSFDDPELDQLLKKLT
jgi:anti-sigma28 factor (negative regulator of flagellin synthesis)